MTLTNRQVIAILKDYNNGDGMSNPQLAAKYGVTPPTIRTWLIKWGVYKPQRRLYARATDMGSIGHIRANMKRMKEALSIIASWKLPPSGRTWNGTNEPMSYRAAHGVNGEIDYMRDVAKAALLYDCTIENAVG